MKPVKEVQGFRVEAEAKIGAIIAEVSFVSWSISVKYDSTVSIVEQLEISQRGRNRGMTKESRSCRVII